MNQVTCHQNSSGKKLRKTINSGSWKPRRKRPLSAYYFAQLALDCWVAFPNMVECDSMCRTYRLLGNDGPYILKLQWFSFTGAVRWEKILLPLSLVTKIGFGKPRGSSALLVLEDADIDEACEGHMSGTFKNSPLKRCYGHSKDFGFTKVCRYLCGQNWATRVKGFEIWMIPYNAITTWYCYY